MKIWTPETDSENENEAEKYQRPAPSRQFLMECLRDAGMPLSGAALCEAIGVADDPQLSEAVIRRLKAMVREGQVIRNRKGAFGLVSKMDLICGSVTGHHTGFGFLTRDDGGEDLYLPSLEMRKVLHGDRVLARIVGQDRRGRDEAVIVEVVDRAYKKLVGRFFEESGVAYVVPDNPRMGRDFVVPKEQWLGAKNGQYVELAITHYGDVKVPAQGHVVEVLGDHLAPGMEIEVAIRSHQLPHEWPEAVLAETQHLTVSLTDSDLRHRYDLRALPLVTIDGDDAKDFDDAVYCEQKKRGGWTLWVAIADVSHYVQVGSAMDAEALDRGNSVYFPGHVVPMLPEILSNGLCSLNPQVDRLALVCEMSISANGRLTGYEFYEAIIHSHARLTYDLVGGYLDDPASELGRTFLDKFGAQATQIQALYSLYQALKSERRRRGAIDFETTETKINFTENRKIESISQLVRNDAHKLIEECMLCANVATASFLEQLTLPALYRNHDGPKDDKLEKLRQFLGMLGFVIGGRQTKPKPRDFQAILDAVAERPDASIIQTLMLRSMGQARYESKNAGHFGLGYKAYTHFTSPIRRYPDLLVHRVIRGAIRNGLLPRHTRLMDGAFPLELKKWYPFSADKVSQMGDHCSITERRADEATREVVQWLKCEYMSDRIGQTYDGLVSSVAPFGIFVQLEGIYVEGAVHVSNLEGDYYHFDPVAHTLTGERTGRQFRMGDPVKVLVAGVDLGLRQIDLELLSSPDAKSSKPSIRQLLAEGHLVRDRSARKTDKKHSRGSGKQIKKATTDGRSPSKEDGKKAIHAKKPSEKNGKQRLKKAKKTRKR